MSTAFTPAAHDWQNVHDGWVGIPDPAQGGALQEFAPGAIVPAALVDPANWVVGEGLLVPYHGDAKAGTVVPVPDPLPLVFEPEPLPRWAKPLDEAGSPSTDIREE